MKCKYKYCKNGGEVEKDKAIKEGSSYYCSQCYEEKNLKREIEEYYINNLPQTTLVLLRKVVNQLINEQKRSAEYVLFVLKHIKSNNKTLNNPFGVIGYCNNGYIEEEFKERKTKEKYRDIKDTIKNNDIENDKVMFTYKPSKKKITDII